MTSTDQTVDKIVQQVQSLLSSPPGQEKLARFNGLAGEVVASLPKLRELRARLHRRASMQFHVNVSSAKQAHRGRVVLSARVRGIECGVVTVGLTGDRVFAPRNRSLFEGCGADAADGLEWGKAGIARYVEAVAAAHAPGRPEAAIESALILTMKGSREAWRGSQQPVCLAGLPFQVPLPVTASGAAPGLGDGHIDVLARLEPGAKGLRVYEVKQPDATVAEVRGALAQAVAYVAALKQVLAQGKASEPWWRLIGFKNQPVRRRRFEAFAVVADTQLNRDTVESEIRRLGSGNDAHIMLGCLYYKRNAKGELELRDGRSRAGELPGASEAAPTLASGAVPLDAHAGDGMTLPPCMDCNLSSDEPGVPTCPHWTPSHWEAQGYERGWGDAAVMNWPMMEILRRESPETIDYIILAPHALRRPVRIYVDRRAGDSWGGY